MLKFYKKKYSHYAFGKYLRYEVLFTESDYQLVIHHKNKDIIYHSNSLSSEEDIVQLANNIERENVVVDLVSIYEGNDDSFKSNSFKTIS